VKYFTWKYQTILHFFLYSCSYLFPFLLSSQFYLLTYSLKINSSLFWPTLYVRGLAERRRRRLVDAWRSSGEGDSMFNDAAVIVHELIATIERPLIAVRPHAGTAAAVRLLPLATPASSHLPLCFSTHDTRCYNVRSKADMSQLNLPHGTTK